MRRIFFKQSSTDAPPSLRRPIVAMFILASAGSGVVAGNRAATAISSSPDMILSGPQVVVVVDALTVNIPGRGTLKFDARLSLEDSGRASDVMALRDEALQLATAAGMLPLVRQSGAVIPAMEKAVGAIAGHWGYDSIRIENAALYKTGI